MRNLTFFIALTAALMAPASVNAQQTPPAAGLTGLITNVSQFSSNKPFEQEGSALSGMLDTDPATYWQSNWHDQGDGIDHYLQVEFPEGISGDLLLHWQRRNTTPHHLNITISASPNGTDFTQVAFFEYTNPTNSEELVTPKFTVPDGTHHIRFSSTLNTNGKRPIFYATFNIYRWSDWEDALERLEMLEEVAEMKASGLDALAVANNDRRQVTDARTETRLITDNSQFTSPFTETREGDINKLIDNNAGTYWHSSWASVVPLGTHYIQVALADPHADQQVALVMSRRAVQNDHITEFEVRGSNEPDLGNTISRESLTLLATLPLPFGSNNETITSLPFNTSGYKYLRFYITNTHCPGAGGSSRGYGHASELQLYPASWIGPDVNQRDAIGEEIYTALQTAIAAIPENEGDITEGHHDALKTAYEAFMAIYVDPSALRAAIAAADKFESLQPVGTNPGYWTTPVSFSAVLAAAKAYDKAGVYTADEVADHIVALTPDMDAILAAANTVTTGKWYRIKTSPKALYQAQGWGTGNLSEGNYNTAISAGTNNTNLLNGQDVTKGTQLFLTADNEGDGQLFRFISVGEDEYAIQNKATGLYIFCAGTTGKARLEIVPSIFTVRALGYGRVLINAKSLAGDNKNNLHIQNSDASLVTWDDTRVESNSGLEIAQAEDVAGNYTPAPIVRNAVAGTISMECWPAPMSTPKGMFEVLGTYTNATSQTVIALKNITTAEAGKPFVFIHGSDVIWNGSAVDCAFTIGGTVTKTPQAVKGLTGVFANTNIPAGNIIIAENKAKMTEGESTQVAANGAYIIPSDPEISDSGEYDLEIVVGEKPLPVAIEKTLQKVAQAGNVYDMSGRQVATGATLNEVQRLPAGTYILNGVKVSVK